VTFGRFDLFETEPIKEKRETQEYGKHTKVPVHKIAVAEGPSQFEVELRHHRVLVPSLVATSETVEGAFKSREFATLVTFTVRDDSLDGLYPETAVRCLKLGVESPELQVLRGAAVVLGRSLQGVRAEVRFSPVFGSAPLLGAIAGFLRRWSRILLHLHYAGRCAPRSPFALDNCFGRLGSSDGARTKSNGVPAELPSPSAAHALWRQYLLLLLNGTSDNVVEALVMWVELEGFPHQDASSPMHQSLKRQVPLLLRELHYIPQADQQVLRDAWDSVFVERFPERNASWETLDQ
jgi:hypothetical protein